MIQPAKKFHVLSLNVKGFKGFLEEASFTFGDMNTITGHNGQGKSSAADAIAFAITTTQTSGTFPQLQSFGLDARSKVKGMMDFDRFRFAFHLGAQIMAEMVEGKGDVL